MTSIVVIISVYVNGLFVFVNEFISCIHFHLECYIYSSLWVT
jgi:hypothetical protein